MELEQLCVGSPSPFLGPGLFLGLGTPLNLPEKRGPREMWVPDSHMVSFISSLSLGRFLYL